MPTICNIPSNPLMHNFLSISCKGNSAILMITIYYCIASIIDGIYKFYKCIVKTTWHIVLFHGALIVHNYGYIMMGLKSRTKFVEIKTIVNNTQLMVLRTHNE